MDEETPKAKPKKVVTKKVKARPNEEVVVKKEKVAKVTPLPTTINKGAITQEKKEQVITKLKQRMAKMSVDQRKVVAGELKEVLRTYGVARLGELPLIEQPYRDVLKIMKEVK